MGRLETITEDDIITEMVDRALVNWDLWGPGPRGEIIERIMRPVLVDIAVAVYRDEVDDFLARRMGLDQALLDVIIRCMKAP